ncbi:MAG: hypothetical protein ACOC1F_00455 [Myxococcota bacterium]
MYTDLPKAMSLFDPAHASSHLGVDSIIALDPERALATLHARYRMFWSEPSFARLQREYPCYMVPDDHEWIDNWGSHPDHHRGAWAVFGNVARRAAYDFEVSRMGGVPRTRFTTASNMAPSLRT